MTVESNPALVKPCMEPIYVTPIDVIDIDAVPLLDSEGNPLRDDTGTPLYE